MEMYVTDNNKMVQLWDSPLREFIRPFKHFRSFAVIIKSLKSICSCIELNKKTGIIDLSCENPLANYC